MKNHDYVWDTNKIHFVAKEYELEEVQEYINYLDDVLYNIGSENMTKEYRELVEKTLELLHQIVGNDNENLYRKGYDEGYEDARDEIISNIM